MSNRPKILMLNIGLLNKGNFALACSIIETIKKFIPDAKFTFMGRDEINTPELQVKKKICTLSIRKPLNTIISLLYLIKCIYIYILRRFGLHISIAKNSRLFEYYRNDIIINSGGDCLSGEMGVYVLSAYVNILYAILLDKPVILYGESLGYYRNPIINSIAKFILNRTSLILVREQLSKNYLDNNGITKPKVYLIPDTAFTLTPSSQSRVLEILLKEGISDIPKPVIGINPSGLISRFIDAKDKKAEEKITNIIVQVIDNLIENLNVTIIMIPHVYSSYCDDRVAINRIFQSVKNKPKAKVIKNEYNSQELKGIIGQCDLFIGMRMHATIASTSTFVPTIGIAYSHKMQGIIGKMLGQEKYIINIKELDYEILISKIYDAWNNRAKIKEELKAKIPALKEKALYGGKLTKELFDSLDKSNNQ